MKSSQKVSVQLSNSIHEDTIILPHKLVKKFKIHDQYVTLQIGAKQQFVKLLPSTKHGKMLVHTHLLDYFSLPLKQCSNTQLYFHYSQQESILKAGPVLCVLLNATTNEQLEQPFGNLQPFCQELILACESKGIIIYFVTPENLQNFSQTIIGWYFDGEWKKQSFPLPNIVYNRLANRKSEKKVQHFFQFLSKNNIPFFNTRFLDKNEVFSVLQKDPSVQGFLPHSFLFTQYEQLKQMLKQYGTIYIKPSTGKMGQGIYRVFWDSGIGKYRLENANQIKIQAKYYSSLEKIYAYLKPKMNKQSYQIQQGLNIIQVGKKPVDFRVLAQKNGSGLWSITSIVARTAADDLFVSNLAMGGTLSSVENILPLSNLNKTTQASYIMSELQQTALLLANSLDLHCDAHLGELGIDLAVDQEGKIWLIEINSKPSKIKKTKTNSIKIRPSVKKLISYAMFLYGVKEGR